MVLDNLMKINPNFEQFVIWNFDIKKNREKINILRYKKTNPIKVKKNNNIKIYFYIINLFIYLLGSFSCIVKY